MFLAIDTGNTSTHCGIYDNEKLVKTFRINSDINSPKSVYEDFFRQEFEDFNITSCLIASVNTEFNSILQSTILSVLGFEANFLTIDMCKELKVKTQHPKAVGADRLADIYGITENVYPSIIIDIGTAITFDILASANEYIGGLIIPGLDMQLKALHEFTSKLPRIKIKESPSAIANSTETAILSGVIRGTAQTVEGMIYQCEQELGKKTTIIATGGQCEILEKYMNRKFDIINHNLTLDGIKRIAKNNNII